MTAIAQEGPVALVLDALERKPQKNCELMARTGLTKLEVRAAIDIIRTELAVWYAPSKRGFWKDGTPPPGPRKSPGGASTRWKRETSQPYPGELPACDPVPSRH